MHCTSRFFTGSQTVLFDLYMSLFQLVRILEAFCRFVAEFNNPFHTSTPSHLHFPPPSTIPRHNPTTTLKPVTEPQKVWTALPSSRPWPGPSP